MVIILNRDKYKELFDRALFKTFFQSLEWQEFLEKEFKWIKFEHYLYKDEALLSFARFKVFGKEKLVSLPFCEYGGPLPLIEDINFKDFSQGVEKEFDSFKIKFHPQILSYEVKPRKDLRGLTSQTSQISAHWIENLKNVSEQELLGSFRKTLRHEIKNAQEHNLEIKKCSNEQELKQFYNLYAANLKRKKTISYPFSIIKFLYENSGTEILLAFYSAKGGSASGGKVIAGSLFLQYDRFAHYFLSASDYKYRDFSASHLLLWEKIKSLIGKDIILDLGATPKGSSLDIFKSGWGGKEYPILQLGIQRNQENLRSSKLRKILGLLPNFVIKILSRYLIKYRI